MSFKAKINVALGSLVLALLLLAALFYGSTNRYQHHLERNELARRVLGNYLKVSDQSYRKLAALAQAVVEGAVPDSTARANNLYQLETALADLATSLREESVFLDRYPISAQPLDKYRRAANFAAIEAASTELLQRSRYILSLVADGNHGQAAIQLQSLRNDLQQSEFDERIASALGEERRLVELTDAAALRLRRWITVAMPIVVLVFAVFGWLLAIMLSRHLTRSVDELKHGAEALAEGELGHRIAELPEAEFRQLSRAFNGMAAELERRRDDAAKQQQRVEQKVIARTEQLRASNAELERNNHSRRQLLANIGHELRTPLTIISGEAQLGLRQLKKPQAEVQQLQQPLEQVLEQASHTARLVDDLLFIARSEVSEPGLNAERCDWAELVQSSAQAFRSLAGEQVIRCEATAPMILNADIGRLRQVVNILLDNAVRYSSGAGDITLHLSHDQQGYSLIASNEGEPLPADEGEKVFERFYRGGHDSGHAEGSGLGLPVARAIVEAHGGSIGFESRPRGGAEIKVWLPTEEIA